jgi:hypothetical protein
MRIKGAWRSCTNDLLQPMPLKSRFCKMQFCPPSAKVKPWSSALSSLYYDSNYIKAFLFVDIFDKEIKKRYFS